MEKSQMTSIGSFSMNERQLLEKELELADREQKIKAMEKFYKKKRDVLDEIDKLITDYIYAPA